MRARSFDPDLFRNRIGFPVRYSDIDAMGHVNNARYVTFFEEGRAFWCRECLGMAEGSLAYPVIVARIAIDYLAPVAFGTQVTVHHRCTRIGSKSMDLEAWIMVEGENGTTPAAFYEIVLVWFDYEKQVATEIPDEIRKRIIAFEPGL